LSDFVGDGVEGFKRGDRVRLQHATPHRDGGDVGIVAESGYRMVLVRFDHPDRNGASLDVVSADDLERVDDRHATDPEETG
jgi:hypothetical protein